MTNSDIIALREIFRNRMKDVDFCIGEAQVEKLFRELLNEPEPESMDGFIVTDKENAKALRDEIEKLAPQIKVLFERDDKFYKLLKK